MKNILFGLRARIYYDAGKYEEVANLIKQKEAAIIEIDSLDDIYELIHQLRQWDDCCVITGGEKHAIQKFLIQNNETRK